MNLPQQLEHRMAQGRLSHAYLIAGEGRRELADLLARAFVCTAPAVRRPCGVCAGCRKALGGIHPDIIRLTSDALKADELRALRSDAYIRPNEAERKVYLVERAETMNDSGQNILLKLLEEGPPYAAFLFLVPNGEELLPTLRSRCESLRAQEEAAAPAEHPAAASLVACLLAGDTLGLVQGCVALEKEDRESLRRLLEDLRLRLRQHLPQRGAQLLPLLAGLDELRRKAQFNMGAGHLAGLLMVLLTQTDETGQGRA